MERLEIADLGQGDVITTSPLVFHIGNRGFAALFPYGTALLAGVSRTDERAFLQNLGAHIESRLDALVVHESEIEIGANEDIFGQFDHGPGSVATAPHCRCRRVIQECRSRV